MNNYFSPKFSVSEEVRSTAVALIKEFNIDRTFDLALFLNVNPNLNDQDAVLAWVNYFSKIQHNLNDFNQVRRHFMKNFPKIMFANLSE
ncbi:hypothetical protein ACWKWF_06005 [Acinetobacter kookii]